MSKRPKEEKKNTTGPPSFEVKGIHLWILTLLTCGAYYWYSTKSVGYYQDDELAHFMNMLGFWDDPASIMGNWNKPGYKLLYVLPAKAGYNFVVLLNCAVSALGCWLAAKTTRLFYPGLALAAFILAALQPVWIELSFRNYADIFSGVLLIAAVYFSLKEKWVVAALFLSYDIMVRQELLPIFIAFGLFLLYKRKMVPALLLGLFPLLYCFWTLQAKGDFLFILHDVQATSAASAEYRKLGLNHFPLMSAVCFGAVQIALVCVMVYYILKNTFKKTWLSSPEGKLLFVFIPALFYFGFHCIINMKSPSIGPSTDGNLRYMTVIGPLVAVLAALAIDYSKNLSRKEIYIVSGVIGALVLIFMTYKHNYIMFDLDDRTREKQRDWMPFIIFMAGAALFFISLKGWPLVFYVLGACLVFAAVEVHPKKLSPEHLVVQKCFRQISRNPEYRNRPILTNHAAANFFYYRETNTTIKNLGSLDSTHLEQAPRGTIIIWDNRYGYRPLRTKGSVLTTYFDADTATYRFLQPYLVQNKEGFAMGVYEKIK